MKITIKSTTEIEKMRIAGKLAAEVLEMIAPFVKAGITTRELDALCHDYIVNVQHAIPACLNYHGFPKSICTSRNEVICHGIPGDELLADGDIINLDITVIKDGYYGDTSKMFIVGNTTKEAKRLVQTAHEALFVGIRQVKPGIHLSDIGAAIQKYTEKQGFSVVRDYCGHGIGLNFHEAPAVLHYGLPHQGPILKPGMTFTIEPMINIGTYETELLDNNWTVVTRDRQLSAQWEHTILVTAQGYEILTLRSEEHEARRFP